MNAEWDTFFWLILVPLAIYVQFFYRKPEPKLEVPLTKEQEKEKFEKWLRESEQKSKPWEDWGDED